MARATNLGPLDRRPRRNAVIYKPKTETPARPRKDAAAEMFKGTPLENAAYDPVNDPLWLPIEQAEKRRSVMAQMKAWHDSTAPCGFYDYFVELDGQAHYASDFYVWQDRMAYDLLLRNVDVRSIAVATYLSLEAVKEIAARYGIAVD